MNKVIEIKKMEGVQPFNKFMFISCYYHHLLSAYRYFGVDENIILSNYLSLYSFDETEKKLEVRQAVVLNEERMLELTGVMISKQDGARDIIGGLCGSIVSEELSIVSVDSFYLPYREDAYLKKHLHHYILVFGFDKENKIFNTIDHLFENSLIYREHNIGFDVLENAFKQYLINLAGQNGRALVKVKRVADKSTCPMRFGLTDSMRLHMDGIMSSYCALKRAAAYILQALRKRPSDKNDIQGIIDFLGIAKWRKVSQKSVFGFHFGLESPQFGWADRITDDFIFIHGLIAKLNIKGVFDDSSIRKIEERLFEILALERNIAGMSA